MQMKYEEFIREQRFVNENICPLNCLGKWIWHGAFTEPANFTSFGEEHPNFKQSAFDRATKFSNEVVKWAKEVINTSPENLQLSVFDDDSGAVQIKQNGIYEILFVFFVPNEIY